MKTIESKEPYLKKLDTRGNVYEQFVPDQVLTHNNLNKIVNYFEDQDRLSRIHLSGVGIGCGLNITAFTKNKIEIGQGVGITTDGDLIKAETSEFLYYTPYSDKGEYPLFNGLDVFEIHTQEGAGHIGEQPLSSLINLQNYIVIAYVENYTEDEGLCDGFDCDDSGTKVYANLKFLITLKDNFAALTAADTIYNNHNVLAYYDGLPEIQMPRILLNKNNTKAKNAIYAQYRNKIVSNNLLIELCSTYITIIDKLNHRINFEKFGVRKIEINTLFNNLFGTISGAIEKSIQYKYDFVKDLLETYQQIRNELLHIHFECVPTVKSFPKHLLLGTLLEQTRLQTRHQFYPSPIVTSNDEKLMKVRSLVIKFFYQLKQYRIPEAKSAAIKITPSKSYESKLSLRAIPYYYQTKNALVKNWNFNDLQNRKETNQLGYHKNNLKNTPSIQKPLEYTHLDKNFYRIEGHLGKDYRTALNKINKIKTDNNLAFDVKTISVGIPVSSVNLNDIKCENKNYLTLLKTWEKDFSCKAESAITFFSQYSTETVGSNYTSPLAYAKVKKTAKTVEVADIIKKRTTDAKVKKMYGKTTASKGVNSPHYATSLEAAVDSAYVHVQQETYTSLAFVAIIETMLESVVQIDRTSDDYFFYIRNPLRIIADLQVLKRDFIQDLNGFYQTNKWTAFNAALNQLCIDLKQAILRLSNQDSDNTTFGTRDYDKMYDYFIYELSDFCCLKEKMAWLKEQLDEVRVNLYKDLILSELIQKHPGLEHMAGVPKGGTFLMVYEGGVESIAVESTRTFKREILFDFALPYMCVSDCPPETIVYQIETPTTPDLVGLEITPQVFCAPADTETFTVTPTGAELTSPQTGNFIEGDEANGYTFIPNNVSDALAGEPITFLVNNEAIPTNEVEIRVYKLPTEDSIAAIVSQVWTAQGLEVEFSINHALIVKNYFVYTWKTDTGEILTPISVISPNKILFPDTDNTVFKNIHLEVTINNNLATCTLDSNTITINATRPQEEVDLDIAKKIYCLPTDIAAVQFMIHPNDAEVKCEQDNSLVILENNKYFFAPENIDNTLLGQPLTFTVNDEVIPPSDVQIQVYKLPETVSIHQIGTLNWQIEGANVKVNVTHELENQTYFTYSWEYKGRAITPTRTRNLEFEFLLPEAGNTISGTLRLIITVDNQEVNCIQRDNIIRVTGQRPVTDITTGVDIAKTNFCLPEENTKEPIKVIPDGATLTAIPAGSFIEGDKDKGYEFNPDKVTNSLLGQPIKFLVDGEIPDTTQEVKVYKLPTKVSPIYKKVTFDNTGITINLNTKNQTNLEKKSYLEYRWFLNDGNGNKLEIAQIKKADNVFISNTGTNISGELELQLKVKNVDGCTDSYTIPIKETRTDSTPTPELICKVPLQERFNRLDIKNTIKTVTEIVTIDNFKNLIVDPTNALLTGIKSTANFTVVTINKRLNEIKALRERLANDYIRNSSFNNFLPEFLKIDEVLEILALEILRCITRSQFKKTQEVINEFFAFSKNMTTFRKDVAKIQRELIKGAYITAYNPKVTGIKTNFTSTFTNSLNA